MGAEIHAHDRDGARVKSVSAHAAGRDLEYGADWFIVASGGFASGAIELDADWQTHEHVLGLPLTGVPGPGEPRFVPDYDSEQPMARAGIACDENLIAQGTDNVLVVGAALAGAASWQEGSGEGIALASAVKAAQVISGNRSQTGATTEATR
jgi:glycerol-3-phosphate dehydrogenase subunit B